MSEGNRLLHCRAGAMRVNTSERRTATALGKSAVMACIFYTLSVPFCLRAQPHYMWATLPAATFAPYLDAAVFDALARFLLPHAMYAHLRTDGLMSGMLGRATVGGWKGAASHLLPASSLHLPPTPMLRRRCIAPAHLLLTDSLFPADWG